MLAQPVDIWVLWEGGLDADVLGVEYERVGAC